MNGKTLDKQKLIRARKKFPTGKFQLLNVSIFGSICAKISLLVLLLFNLKQKKTKKTRIKLN